MAMHGMQEWWGKYSSIRISPCNVFAEYAESEARHVVTSCQQMHERDLYVI